MHLKVPWAIANHVQVVELCKNFSEETKYREKLAIRIAVEEGEIY